MGLERMNIMTSDKPFPLHPFATAFRAWDKDEAKSAEVSIEQVGQLDPVIVYSGHVIDGANRQRALVKAGQPIRWVDVTEDLDRKGISVESYVTAKNISRRHLSASERALAVAKVLSGGDISRVVKRGRGRPTKAETERIKNEGLVTTNDIQAVANVDLRDAISAVSVITSGREDVIDQVGAGKIRFRDAAPASKGEVSPEDKSLGMITKIEQHMGQIVRTLHEINTETPVKGYESCRAALNAAAKHIANWKDTLLSRREDIRSQPSGR